MSIESVVARYESELMGLPGVVGVGIGEREGEPAIQVMVAKRVPVAPGPAVPESLEGYPVTVVEVGTITGHLNDEDADGY